MPDHPIPPVHPALPEVFRLQSGRPVSTPADWQERRQELRALMLAHVYGELPPAAPTRWTTLHRATVRIDTPGLAGATLVSGRVSVGGLQPREWALQLWLPAGPGPFPVVLNGDACWHYATDAVKALLLQRGHALALFNRVDIASDRGDEGPATQGPAALAWWAWAFQRCADVLLTLPEVRPDRLMVSGHSRGGKAALLAGALDERFALTAVNNSGAAGAGSFKVLGEGAETLADLVRGFPHWAAPALARYVGRESALPLDQHFLKALVAPRALLCTEALGDAWANPAGTWHTHRAALPVWQWLGAPHAAAVHYREGGHAHTLADWAALLDFAAACFDGAPWSPHHGPFGA